MGGNIKKQTKIEAIQPVEKYGNTVFWYRVSLPFVPGILPGDCLELAIICTVPILEESTGIHEHTIYSKPGCE